MMPFHNHEVAEMDEGKRKNQKGDTFLRVGRPRERLHP
jgi:hypothetical protein